MKILCPSCAQLAGIAAFRTEQGTLYLRCARCDAENVVSLSLPPEGVAPAPRPSSSSSRVVPLRPVTDAVKLAADTARQPDPFAVPEDRCPKCVGERAPDGLICPHCGLVFVNFRPEELAPSDELRTAFLSALRQWDAREAHESALEIAERRGELVAAGRLYRLRLAAAPHDPIAQRGRDEVMRRAVADPGFLRSSRPTWTQTRAPRWQYAVLGVLILGVAGLMAVLFGRMFG